MAIQEDLIYFLKNGKLKNIDFGIPKKRFIEILGEPDYIGQHTWADIYSYDCFEFYLSKEEWKGNKVERFDCFVVIDPEMYSKDINFIFEGYGWTKDLTIEDAISFLNEHKIVFEEKSFTDEPNFRSFYTEANVFIQFTDFEETGNFTLYKFGRRVELNPIKPPTKQVSFEIEETFYNQLKETAEKTKISIANQCREIIENHLETDKK